MKTISALNVRSKLGTVLDEVSQEGEHYIIERLSRPLAVLLPIEEYQAVFKLKNLKKNADELLKELSSFRKKYGKKLSGKHGTTHLLQKMRTKRTKNLIQLIK
ncbi:type II toxin-antitoxin system Phd/YefM family antitoxin [Candidatus Roizmanbacteria bacterium]|nr:type II toxin-antitoxin system Phd/YefM family antitoxin [Candidatus Roizmanbacteria bacterium]